MLRKLFAVAVALVMNSPWLMRARIESERLVPAPDCGMKYLSRELAFAKLKALADGAAIVRAELS